VDVRKQENGEWKPVPDNEARDVHFVEVEPFFAVKDDDYYVNLIKKRIEK
jgi:hypothetical protein